LSDGDLRERAWRARATALPTAASGGEIAAAVEAAAAGPRCDDRKLKPNNWCNR